VFVAMVTSECAPVAQASARPGQDYLNIYDDVKHK
jgi:hypothetical protein